MAWLLQLRQLRPLRAIALAYHSFDAHDGVLLAGGIAFFSMLSVAPMLVIALGLASVLVGDLAVSGVMRRELEPVLGAEPARFLSELVERAGSPEAGGVAAVLAGLVTLYASTRVFVELQTALHRVWELELGPTSSIHVRAWQFLYRRLIAFMLVLLLGLLVTALLVAEAALQWVARNLEMFDLPGLLRVTHLALVYVALTTLIAAIYRALTSGYVHWGNALRGAAVTALLMGLGGAAVGAYLRVGFSHSVYGAAGSFAALMLAAYYSAIIFLYGAELAHAYRMLERSE